MRTRLSSNIAFLIFISINAQVSMNTNTPQQVLDINGKVKVGNDATPETEDNNFQNLNNIGASQQISCSMTEAEVKTTGTPTITFGGATYYIGYRLVSASNQNSIILKFTAGSLDWCREDYDTTASDSKGYGLFWSGTNLFAIFSIDGTQGSLEQSYARFTSTGWQTNYGQGGGSRIAVIIKINETNGSGIIDSGTFVKSQLTNGNTNTLAIKDIFLASNNNLVVRADSFFSPLNTDTTRITCSGTSPLDYTIIFNPDLTTAVCASATNCNNLSGTDCLTTLNTNLINEEEIIVENNVNQNSLTVKGVFKKKSDLKIYDLNSRLILTEFIAPNVSQQYFNLNTLNSGVYIVKIEYLEQIKVQKIIVK